MFVLLVGDWLTQRKLEFIGLFCNPIGQFSFVDHGYCSYIA